MSQGSSGGLCIRFVPPRCEDLDPVYVPEGVVSEILSGSRVLNPLLAAILSTLAVAIERAIACEETQRRQLPGVSCELATKIRVYDELLLAEGKPLAAVVLERKPCLQMGGVPRGRPGSSREKIRGLCAGRKMPNLDVLVVPLCHHRPWMRIEDVTIVALLWRLAAILLMRIVGVARHPNAVIQGVVWWSALLQFRRAHCAVSQRVEGHQIWLVVGKLEDIQFTPLGPNVVAAHGPKSWPHSGPIRHMAILHRHQEAVMRIPSLVGLYPHGVPLAIPQRTRSDHDVVLVGLQ
mmetsp:Transcript_17373/g.40752  ORF Transcript_17373/g.40752 Transcript_17373/m.40752 type:complete len:292 (+) Transcript_17373:93-968(+)